MNQDHPHVYVPPPVIFAGALLIGWVVGWWWPAAFGGGAWRHAIALALAVASAAIGPVALVLFRRAETNFETWKPAEKLVVAGPYRFTRNPMYVSMTLLAIAIALWADSWAMAVAAAPAWSIINWIVIPREERHLLARFGQDYRDYCARVRRWL